MFKSMAILAVVAMTAFAADKYSHLCEGFLPENDMKIPVGMRTFSGDLQGISEAEFNAVIDQAYKFYTAEVKAKGGSLVINRKWTDETVNAQASQWFGTWYLDMYGGLARSKPMTIEGFSLVVCHEMGHHLGGAPKNGWPMSWGTNEGGADYFATAKCLRRMWENEDNRAAIGDRKIDEFAQAACDREFQTVDDRLICYRSTLAGEAVAALFQQMKEEQPSHFATPDPKKVNSTDNAHPATQCRLDTYFQGALCTVAETEDVDNRDYHVGTCTAKTHQVGLRPRCWFKPDNAEL